MPKKKLQGYQVILNELKKSIHNMKDASDHYRLILEIQVVQFANMLISIEIPAKHVASLKAEVKKLFDEYPNSKTDEMNDFFDKIALTLKERGLEHLLTQEDDDPDKRKPRSAKEHLKHLLKNL